MFIKNPLGVKRLAGGFLNLLVLLVLIAVPVRASENTTAYDFEFETIEGERLPLSDFTGNVLFVVNTASFCGFTRQYDDLQTIWNLYRDDGLIVLGVPSNDFGGQEPSSEKAIKDFCEVNFSVDFPLTHKVRVRGANAHPFYRWAAAEFGLLATPQWNFHKYLVNRNGNLVDWFSSATSPTSKRVLRSIIKALDDGTNVRQKNVQ